MRAVVARFLGFGAAPMIAAIVPLFVLPIAARIDGSAGWAAIGTGQAIGAFCAMISSYGWNVNGGARIALAADEDEQRRIYAASFWCRLVVFALVGTAGAMLSATLVGGDFAHVAALATLATGATGLTLVWYAVGVGSARLVLWFEAVPFAVFTLASAVTMLLTGLLVLYPVLTLAGVFVGLVLLHVRLFRRPVPPLDARAVLASFRANIALAIADGIGGSYTTAPVPIAQAAIGTQAAAELTSADRVYRIGLNAIVVLGNSLQKWVLEATFAEGRLRRHVVALGLHLLVGVTGLVVLIALGPLLTRVLLGEAVTPPAEVFPVYGITFLIISMTTPLIRNVLVPAGQNRIVLVAIVVSAIAGLPVMIAGGMVVGTGTAIVVGLAVSELLVLTIVGIAAVAVLRREGRAHRHPA